MYNTRHHEQGINWEYSIKKLRECGGYFGDLMDLLLIEYIDLEEQDHRKLLKQEEIEIFESQIETLQSEVELLKGVIDRAADELVY